MKLQLISQKMRNFKGIREIEIKFHQIETFIYGRNAAGKTTIFDAICYLLFGKDSQDNKTFPIQTLDKNGNRIDHLETEVSAVFLYDKREIELKRVYKQKWTKKRGSEKPEFTGYEEDLFINEVPCQLKEYKKRIDDLILESVFKEITNVTIFPGLHWTAQRSRLMDMAKVSNDDVAAGNPIFEALIVMLAKQGKSLEDYKKEVAAKKKKIKEEIVLIPARIDEADQAKPLVKDWVQIEKQIKEKSAQIEEIENSIGSQIDAQKALNKTILAHDNNVLTAKRELQRLESGLRSEYDQPDTNQKELDQAIKDLKALQAEKTEIANSIIRYNQSVNQFNAEIESLQAQKDALLAQWTIENEKKFEMDPNDCKCPTCQREFESDNLEAKKSELETNFNAEKKRNLDTLNVKGKNLAEQIATLKQRIVKGDEAIAQMNESESSVNHKIGYQEALISDLELNKTEKQPFESFRDGNAEYLAKKAEIAKLESEAPQPDESLDTIRREKQSQKAAIQAEIDTLKASLTDRERISQLDTRIEELTETESKLAQQLAAFEKDEFTMLEFTKAKVAKIEEVINSKFKVVRFKMFNQLINGGEEECCEITVDGVPYPNVNQAGKVKASLDIINALCDHYEVYAPIFLDGRESVTEIIPVSSQVINLIVSPSDEKLRVA